MPDRLERALKNLAKKKKLKKEHYNSYVYGTLKKLGWKPKKRKKRKK